MEDIKKAIIGVITLAITTAGGLLINKLLKGEEDEKVETEVVTPVAPANVIINIPEQKKDTVVKKVYVKPKPKLSETEKRKKKIDW
tara:strand:+ start:586 stop:843 length:258 start_codon:yes stop_codon:yes gene_type:complete